MLSNAASTDSTCFEMFIPQMPLHSLPFNIVFHLKNISESDDYELKIFKRTSCDCSLMHNRKRKSAHVNATCPHRNIAGIRPASVHVKSNNFVNLEMVFRYELAGQQEITFHIV